MKFRFSNRGQVSTELLVGVFILFIFLIIVFLQNYFVSNSTLLVSDVYEKKGECLRLAFAISKVYTEGSGTQITFDLANDANIIALQKMVAIGDNYCGFLAMVQNSTLAPGKITLRNTNGIVIFS